MCKKIFLSTLLFSNFFLFSGGDKELDLSSSEDKEKYDTIILTLKEEETAKNNFVDGNFTKKVVIAKIKGNDEEILIFIHKSSVCKNFELFTAKYNLDFTNFFPNKNLFRFDKKKFRTCLYEKEENAYEALNKKGDTLFIQCEKSLLRDTKK